MSKPRVLMAMSGGVDSSVAAMLLQRAGYEVAGVTMHLYCPDPDAPIGVSSCCSLDDIDDARAVAHALGLQHHVFNFQDVFEREVIGRFCEGYLAGATPNPCIDCNQHLKFDLLHRRRRELGFDYLATGHYARIERCGDGTLGLLRGVDPRKDQSYVLYCIPPAELEHTLFPLGGLSKGEVRALAADAGLATAEKGESQDICFVPNGNYAEFLERRLGKGLERGPVLDEQGHVLGEHCGLARYTVGQRKGLNLGGGTEPLYVLRKDAAANTIVVGPRESLLTHVVHAAGVNVLGPMPCGGMRGSAKIGYNHRAAACTAMLDGDTLEVTFDEPVAATAPGQALVFYADDRVMVGGTII